MLIVVTLYFYVFLSEMVLIVVTLYFYIFLSYIGHVGILVHSPVKQFDEDVFLSEMGHVDCSYLVLLCFPE